jgi:hypothetical protein
MGRKVFQDFAHVLCQKFVEVPSNRDLVNLAILGDGVLRLDITARKATHNGFAIEPLPFVEESLRWIESRLDELAIPRGELSGANLTVDSRVKLHRKPGVPFLTSRCSRRTPRASPRSRAHAATPRAAPAAPRGRGTLESDLGVRC